MYKVLIVDDDLATLYLLKRFKKWREFGFLIEGEASDGREALRKLYESSFDLIITDIKMPGMDGIEFIQELRSKSINTCVVFLSTHSDFQFAKQGIRFGVFEYLTKPVDEEILSDILVRAKAVIDAKKEQEAKLNGLEKAQEEESPVYYPVDHENQLISFILAGDPKIEEASKETLYEICNLYDNNMLKVRVLVNSLLYNLRAKLDDKFPWLKRIEGISTFPDIKDLTEIKDIEKEFTSQLISMQKKVHKYHLNHPDSIIRKICQCIIDNIENEISLEFIANEVHISRDYVGKLFKQKVSCNFNDYVTKIKMEHAKYLILSGDYKNYEISEKLGYKKTDYFSALFKAYTGLTPMEYKKNKKT